MTPQIKKDISDVKYELSNVQQLRKLTRQEKVILRHLNGPLNDESKSAMCDQFWFMRHDEIVGDEVGVDDYDDVHSDEYNADFA